MTPAAPATVNERELDGGGGRDLTFEKLEQDGVSRDELRTLGIESEEDLKKIGTTEFTDDFIRRAEARNN